MKQNYTDTLDKMQMTLTGHELDLIRRWAAVVTALAPELMLSNDGDLQKKIINQLGLYGDKQLADNSEEEG